jgi:hypothetical protein
LQRNAQKHVPFLLERKNKAKLGLVKCFKVGIIVGMLMVVALLPLLCPAITTSTIAPTRQGGCQRRRRRRGVVGGGMMTRTTTMTRIWMGGEGRGRGREMVEQPPLYATWATSTPTSQQ